MKYLISTILMFVAANLAYTQEIYCTVYLMDGSFINCKPLFSDLRMDAKYGNVKIPIKDIGDLTIGYYCEPKLYEDIEKNIIGLNSSLYRNRENAAKFLYNYYQYSYVPLKNHPSLGSEFNKRREYLIGLIDIVTMGYIDKKSIYDSIKLNDDSNFTGKLLSKKLKFNSWHLKDFELQLWSIRRIVFWKEEIKEIKVDLTQLYDRNKSWDSGIFVYGRIRIEGYGHGTGKNQNLYNWELNEYENRDMPLLGNMNLCIMYNGYMTSVGNGIVLDFPERTKLYFTLDRFIEKESLVGQFGIKITKLP